MAEAAKANSSAGDAKEQGKDGKQEAVLWQMDPEEEKIALTFTLAAFEEAKRYMAMTEEDVKEEYRRAGKLHKYDPDKEWQKRYARVARIHPPPKHTKAEIDEYMKFLDEEEEED